MVDPYDSRWKDLFTLEAKRLAQVFGRVALTIEHVGSTAVPGMSGKPTLDILVTVEDMSPVPALWSSMEMLEYSYLPGYIGAGTVLFAKERDNERLVNVHVVPAGHFRAEEMLHLRDYLLAHPEERDIYARLKLDLYARYPEHVSEGFG